MKILARQLSNEGTNGEAMLWFNALNDRKMYDYQFYRQYPIGNYIVDFICSTLKLIIEIDGRSHLSIPEYDRVREDDLNSLGYLVLRFSEAEVVYRIDDVVGKISYAVESLEKRNKLVPLLIPPCSPFGEGVKGLKIFQYNYKN